MKNIPSVFATMKAARPSTEQAFASFGCEDCGKPFAVQASMKQPYCVHCGSQDVTASTEDTEVTASIHEELSSADADPGYVQCTNTEHCGVWLVLSSEIETAGHVCCAACGTDVQFTAEENACVTVGAEKDGRTDLTLHAENDVDPNAAVDAAKTTNAKARENNPGAPGDRQGKVLAATDEETAFHDVPDIEYGDDDEDDDGDWEEDSSFEEDASEEETAGDDCEQVTNMQNKVNQHPAPNERDGNPAAEHKGPNGLTEQNAGTEETAGDGFPGPGGYVPEFKHPSPGEVYDQSAAKEKLTQETVQPDGTNNSNNRSNYPAKPVSLLDIVRTSIPGTPALRVGRVEATLYVQYGDYTVAKLEQHNVAANVREFFNTPQYIESIEASIQLSGLDETLASYSFELLPVTINAEAVAALSDERIAEQASVIAASRADASAEEWKNCLAIASVGYTKGMWADANPLRDELVASLSASGIRNPESLVDRCFASAGDQYNEALIEQAFALQNMDVAARNALAHSIGTIRHVAERASATASFQNTQGDLRARLATPMQGSNETTASVTSAPRAGNKQPVDNAVARLKARTQQGGGLF